MKTLCDLFQNYNFEYELFESEEFGTIGILYYAHLTAYVQPFDRVAQDILSKAGAVNSHLVLYVPNLSNEEILTLTMMSALMQNVGFQSDPHVPTEVLVQLRRNRRSWLVNYLADFTDPAIRTHRLEMLAISVVPLITYIGVKALF
ncbi:hypothetical protein [Agrobacterium rosae]|uniref:Uncharacterized protein n=1 Tax=Agrobacterium rosae TaxID=1972867 RepID=A0A1R3TMJ7_9HYPH|nr:hypothetical protein [Agrobacterium rosae]SCX19467.1 hypothetical protein DSM25559_1848 [Agrobacterium rosae]